MYSSTHKPLYLSLAPVLLTYRILKDLPLLDRLGPRYPRGDHSFVLGNRIYGSVILFSFDKSISNSNSSSLAIWLTGYITTALDEATPTWVSTLIVTSLTVSMAVNALVTGLIMFKILKVFLKVKPIYELSSGSTRDTKLQVRHVIFITIESGMALFAIQLIHVVFFIVPVESGLNSSILEYVIVIQQMFNVIIRSVHIYFSCFTDNIYQGIIPTIIMVLVSMSLSFDDKESFKEATESLPTFRINPPGDSNTSSVPTQLGSQGRPEERSDST